MVCVHLVRNLDLAISCCQQHCLTLYSAYNCNQHLLRGSNNAISEHYWHMHIDDIWPLPLVPLLTVSVHLVDYDLSLQMIPYNLKLIEFFGCHHVRGTCSKHFTLRSQ